MSVQQRLIDDMKAAMKTKDKLRLETIRGLRSQFKNMEIEKGHPLSDEEEIQVLMSAAKKRKESIEQFRLVNRPERAAEEENELEIIRTYLPEQLSQEKISELADRIIQEVGASSPKDMGKVMGKMMGQVKGRADGRMVQNVVQQKLSAL